MDHLVVAFDFELLSKMTFDITLFMIYDITLFDKHIMYNNAHQAAFFCKSYFNKSEWYNELDYVSHSRCVIFF